MGPFGSSLLLEISLFSAIFFGVRENGLYLENVGVLNLKRRRKQSERLKGVESVLFCNNGLVVLGPEGFGFS